MNLFRIPDFGHDEWRFIFFREFIQKLVRKLTP